MNPDDDIELDHLLERHFADRLDAQLGRATQAFADYHPRSQRRSRFIGLAVAGMTSAIAASVLLALVPRAPSPHNAPGPVAAADTGTIEQILWSRTTDEGTVFLDDQTPARKVVREQVREVRWTDPAGARHVQSLAPQRDVMLISLDKY